MSNAIWLIDDLGADVDQEIVDGLWELATGSDPAVAEMAEIALGRCIEKDHGALEEWMAFSRSPDPWAREVSTRVAVGGWERVALVGERLHEMIANDSDMTVVAAATKAMAEFESVAESAWLPAVEAVLLSSREGSWRLAAALAPPYPEEVSEARLALVARACEDDSPVVRAAAVAAMSEYGVSNCWWLEPARLDVLWKAVAERIEDPDPRVRRLAATSVAEFSRVWGERFDSRYPAAAAAAREIEPWNVEFDTSEFE